MFPGGVLKVVLAGKEASVGLRLGLGGNEVHKIGDPLIAFMLFGGSLQVSL